MCIWYRWWIFFYENRYKQQNDSLIIKNLRAEKSKKDACLSSKSTVGKRPKRGRSWICRYTTITIKLTNFQCISFILILKLAFVSVITTLIHHCYSSLCFMQYIVFIFKVFISKRISDKVVGNTSTNSLTTRVVSKEDGPLVRPQTWAKYDKKPFP